MFRHALKWDFLNARILAVLGLGFFSGLPLALTGSTMQAWFTESGINVVAIGALSLVGMPYVWKFLWAPIMDWLIPPGGRRRGWLFITQLGLCLALFVLATCNPAVEPTTIGLLALLIAFLSASQDVAFDAYRVDLLAPLERGTGAAAYILAYRVAMLVSGGLALVIADHVGWRSMYQMMAVLMGLATVVTFFAPEVQESSLPPKNIMATVTESVSDLFQRDGIVLLLLFVVFYKLGDALAISLMSNFLLHGLGFTLTDVGLAYKTVSLVGTVLGAFLGGALLARLGLYRALLFFGIAQGFSTLTFMLLAIVGKNYALMVSSLFVENFCNGMGTTAFMAFLMSLCHQRYSATQYACLSALSSIGRVCLGPIAGLMVVHLGWLSFYAWSFALSLPGLMLLGLLRSKVSFHAKLVEC